MLCDAEIQNKSEEGECRGIVRKIDLFYTFYTLLTSLTQTLFPPSIPYKDNNEIFQSKETLQEQLTHSTRMCVRVHSNIHKGHASVLKKIQISCDRCLYPVLSSTT